MLYSTVPSTFDDITREEFLYVNWDPLMEKWHTNADYSIDELKEAIMLLERNIIEFANQSDIRLG